MAIKITRVNMGVVFTPRDEEVYSNSSGVLYPRVIELHHAGELNGMLLATFDHSTIKEPPVVPVWCSRDHGVTWEPYSQIEDTQNGFGIRFQPHIYELPQACADLPAGTIVMCGNSVPLSFASTELSFYVSLDHGKTWQFRSSVVKGGKPIEQNFAELGPVWEPCIYLDPKGNIVVAFTDERPHTDPRFNQTLALTVSEDGGKTWGEVIYTVTIPDRAMRPGMPVVARMGNGKYIMVYEIVVCPCCDIYYKLSDDGIDWGDPLLAASASKRRTGCSWAACRTSSGCRRAAKTARSSSRQSARANTSACAIPAIIRSITTSGKGTGSACPCSSRTIPILCRRAGAWG